MKGIVPQFFYSIETEWESQSAVVQQVIWYFAGDRVKAFQWFNTDSDDLGGLSPRLWLLLGFENELRMYVENKMRARHD